MKKRKTPLANSVYPLSEGKLKRIIRNLGNLEGKRIVLEDGTTTPVIKTAQFTSNFIRLDYETEDEEGKNKRYI